MNGLPSRQREREKWQEIYECFVVLHDEMEKRRGAAYAQLANEFSYNKHHIGRIVRIMERHHKSPSA